MGIWLRSGAHFLFLLVIGESVFDEYHLMVIIHFWSPEQELQQLKDRTMVLVRESLAVQTMKDYIHCYDILDLTDRINKPWQMHPGVIIGDMSAFVDLHSTLKQIVLRQDPSGKRVKEYALAVAVFMNYWRISEENRISRKI